MGEKDTRLANRAHVSLSSPIFQQEIFVRTKRQIAEMLKRLGKLNQASQGDGPDDAMICGAILALEWTLENWQKEVSNLSLQMELWEGTAK
jgi:hypothetical protein